MLDQINKYSLQLKYDVITDLGTYNSINFIKYDGFMVAINIRYYNSNEIN